MAKENGERSAMWKLIFGGGSAIVLIIGLLFALSGQVADRPCRAEMLEADKVLKQDFEKRQAELKNDIIRILNEMKTDQKDALDKMSAEQADMKDKVDRLFNRFSMGGSFSSP